MAHNADLNYRRVNGAYIELSEEFAKALDLMENSSGNVFITGRAGTGKSTLIELFKGSTKKNVAVLAPTGVAALNVKGQTIHSFFMFRPDITPDTVKPCYPQQKARYRQLDAILIDEISMVRADLLDCVDAFMRLNGRDGRLPFGGVQMIFIGDLYQLPPVVTDGESEMFVSHYRSEYFFDSHSFQKLEVSYLELTRHYRHTDERLIRLLNSIRNDTAGEADLEAINSRVDPSFVPGPADKYIALTTTNRLADDINDSEMRRIPGIEHVYVAIHEGKFDKKTMPADETLAIKAGAQVMLLNNDKAGRWVNGSLGTVVAIKPGGSQNPDNNHGQQNTEDMVLVELTDRSVVEVRPFRWELFRFTYDRVKRRLEPEVTGSFTQYPMMLAWAITIHKSQGKTFEHVIIDIGKGTFAWGQLYVALSRCTTLEGMVLRRKIEGRHILMDGRIVEFLESVGLG